MWMFGLFDMCYYMALFVDNLTLFDYYLWHRVVVLKKNVLKIEY